MTNKQLEKIFEELISVYHNLKAEVIVSQLKENSSITIDDVIIQNKSTFKRSHRRDIIEIGSIEDDKLNLYLSRNGLYDLLPEGLFHKKSTEKTNQSLSEIRKIYKAEEKDARHFFSPIENEFFFQKLKIEDKEQEMLDEFLNLDDQFLINFWKVDKSIEKKYLLKLLKLIPYSYKITGDLKLTQLCLESILEKEVTINKTVEPFKNGEEILEETMRILGTNFTLKSENNTVLQPTIEVEIGPIEHDEITSYINKKGVLKFIDVFCDYFFPVEFNIKIKFKVNHNVEFSLNNELEPILGISTKI